MRSTTELQAEIVAAKAALAVAKEKKQEAEKERSVFLQEKSALINSNPVAVQRQKIESLRDNLHNGGLTLIGVNIILDIALFLLLLLFEGVLERIVGGDPLKLQLTILAIPLALIVVGIVLIICGALQKGRINDLADALIEFDEQKQPIEDQIEMYTKKISEYDSFIAQQNKSIADCETEMKYAAYAKNHVMLFVAEEGSSSNHFRSIKNNIIIDGVEYGSASMPFKVIELTPGLHAIRIDVAVYFSEQYHVYSSDVIQVRAENGSVFLKCVFKGPSRPFSIEQFSDINTYFKEINHKP